MDDERTARPDTPTGLADGALAAAVLALALLVIRLAGIDVSALSLLVGVVATVMFEALAGRHTDRVRRAWARPGLRHTVLGGSLAGGIVAVFVRAGWLVVAGAGALGCYLVLLVLIGSGLLAPPRSWSE